MAYDKFNRMTSWTGPAGTMTCTYRGAEWHRASRTANGQTTAFLYDGSNVLQDIQGGAVARVYVTPGLDAYLSMTITGGDDAGTYYYNQDERSSVRNLTNSSGTVVNTYDYTAFGEMYGPHTDETVTQRYQYTGRELNDVAGSHYFRYRSYSAGVGAFTSRDPLGYVDGMSIYNGYFGMGMGRDPAGLRTYWEKCKPTDDCPTLVGKLIHNLAEHATKRKAWKIDILEMRRRFMTSPSRDKVLEAYEFLINHLDQLTMGKAHVANCYILVSAKWDQCCPSDKERAEATVKEGRRSLEYVPPYRNFVLRVIGGQQAPDVMHNNTLTSCPASGASYGAGLILVASGVQLLNWAENLATFGVGTADDPAVHAVTAPMFTQGATQLAPLLAL